MAKYFLGSVGEAEAYEVTRKFSGETTMDLVFTSKTLTESAVNISVNKEQIIDSYNGAPAGVFYHSPNVNITLSDILWNPKFVEASIGSHFNELSDAGNIEYYMVELTADEHGVAHLRGSDKRPCKLDIPSIVDVAFNNSNYQIPYIVMGQLKGDTEWYSYSYNPAGLGTIGAEALSPSPSRDFGVQGVLQPNATYCFKYPIKSIKSKMINITTKIMPEELFLVITTPIFMVDSESINSLNSEYLPEYSCISTGKIVGKVIYEVPRWSLDGDQSFNFSMSGTSGMQLTGTVLESIENEEEPVFMRLREIIKPRAWYENLVDLVSTSSDIDSHIPPTIYGIYADGSYEEIISTVSTDQETGYVETKNIKLVFEPVGDYAENDPGSTYRFDGIDYNVTGAFDFETVSSDIQVIVHPAIVSLDENNNEILVILENISLTLVKPGQNDNF